MNLRQLITHLQNLEAYPQYGNDRRVLVWTNAYGYTEITQVITGADGTIYINPVN